MNYEPDPLTLLQAIPPLFLKQEIYQILLESKASEHSSRMVAMKNATDNAKELRKKLNLEYNKARQAAITQEILEIAAATAQAKQFK
jgi:F-type H+-transporting ATPase subunit gamma